MKNLSVEGPFLPLLFVSLPLTARMLMTQVVGMNCQLVQRGRIRLVDCVLHGRTRLLLSLADCQPLAILQLMTMAGIGFYQPHVYIHS